MKKSKGKIVFLIVLLSFLILLLLGFMISVILGWIPFRGFNFTSYKVSERLAYEEIYDTNFQKIKVDATLGNIEVLPSSDEKIHILIYSDSDLFQIEDTKSDLSITFTEEEGFHFFIPSTKDLVQIYVPATTNSLFTLISDCGDVTVDDFSTAKFEVTANMGDISIDSAKEISVDNDMGDISIGNVCNLKVTQDMGDLEVDTISSKLSIENDMGKVLLKNISLDYDSKIIVNLGDVEIEKISNVYIDATVDLGDIDIANNDRSAPYVLTIQGDMGDITVG